MALPVPNLDDRKFQDIVDESKRNIALRCPEWTEHNVSDPGVTLIELFAWMTELTLYRLNQVPEKNYLKFLEMIGIDLQTGDAARAGITFPLIPGWPGDRVVVPRGTEIATDPVGEEEPIVFTTDRDLVLERPRVSFALAESEGQTRQWDLQGEFRIFSPGQENRERPIAGDSFYLGFDRDITGYILDVTFDAERGAAVGLNPEDPQGEWQYFDTVSSTWQPLPLEGDDPTHGLDRAGTIRFRIPFERFDEETRKIDEKPAWWIRYHYRPREDARQYDLAPLVRSISCTVQGGVVSASNCYRIEREILGMSDGTPGQVFRLSTAPVLELQHGETVEVEADDGGWDPWFRQEDFSASGPNDPHFVCDTITGEVRFGDLLRGPSGEPNQYGRIPATGRRIRFSRYRYGGGSVGNVAAGTLVNLRRAIPFIANDPGNPDLRVTNRDRAAGGSDREELAHAKMRGQRKLRSLTRAVTAEDFEYHAEQALPNAVARARCITPQYPVAGQRGNRRTPPPGEVRVLVVPAVTGNPARLSFENNLRLTDELRTTIREHLEERKLITTRVTVDDPTYVWVSTEMTIRVDPRHDAARVRERVENALHRYLNPIVGGPNDDGWPFGHAVRLVDVRAVAQSIEGVRYVETARIMYRRNGTEQRTTVRGEMLELQPEMLVFSESHRVTVTR